MIDRHLSQTPPIKIEPFDYDSVSSPQQDIKLEDALLAESQHSYLSQPLHHESEEFSVYRSFIQKQTTEVNFLSFFLVYLFFLRFFFNYIK